MTLQISFSHPSLVIYFFATPPIKVKSGQQIRGGLLIANHPEQLLWGATEKHWAAVRSHLLQCLGQVHVVATPFTSHRELSNFAELKPFSWTKPPCFNFSSSNCTVQDHMLSSPRDAVSSRKRPKTYLSNRSITSVMPGAGGCLTGENTQECRAVFAQCWAVFVDFFHF